MKYQVRFERKAQKSLTKIPKKDFNRVIAAISNLENNPLIGNKLEGELKGVYSLRVWPYRIIYKIYKDLLIIVIINIGHRKDVYK